MFFFEPGLRGLQASGAFDAVAGQVLTSGEQNRFLTTLNFDGASHASEVSAVTPNFFTTLGVSIRGRTFTDKDDHRGEETVCIISQGLWQTVFKASGSLINSIVDAPPHRIRIVGIIEGAFQGARLGERTEVWIPRNQVADLLNISPEEAPDGAVPTAAIGLLRPGVSPLRAGQMIRDYQVSQGRRAKDIQLLPISRVYATPTQRSTVVAENAIVELIVGGAALAFGGAIATLLALSLLDFETRRTEFAIKFALGSSLPQLARDVAAERLLVLMFAALGSSFLGWVGLRLLGRLSLPSGIDLGRLELTVDVKMLAAAAGAGGVALLLSSVFPLLRVTRSVSLSALQDSRTTEPSRFLTLKQLLTGVHACITVLVLTLGLLFLRSISATMSEGPGFETEHALFAKIRPAQRLPTSNSEELIRRLQGIGGLATVTLGASPMSQEQSRQLLVPRELQTEGRSIKLPFAFSVVGADYLSALGLRPMAGRDLSVADVQADGLGPAVITKALADSLWPGKPPIGREFSYLGHRLTVVGVVHNLAFGSLDRRDASVIFTVANPTAAYASEVTLLIIATDPDRAARTVTRVAQDTFGSNAFVSVTTGSDLMTRGLARQRLAMVFFTCFAFVGAITGAFGSFALVAHYYYARRRDFGIRLALGAKRSRLITNLAMVATSPAVIGSFAGSTLSLAAARIFSALLVNISVWDPLAYGFAMSSVILATMAPAVAASHRLRDISMSELLKP